MQIADAAIPVVNDGSILERGRLSGRLASTKLLVSGPDRQSAALNMITINFAKRGPSRAVRC